MRSTILHLQNVTKFEQFDATHSAPPDDDRLLIRNAKHETQGSTTDTFRTWFQTYSSAKMPSFALVRCPKVPMPAGRLGLRAFPVPVFGKRGDSSAPGLRGQIELSQPI